LEFSPCFARRTIANRIADITVKIEEHCDLDLAFYDLGHE